MLDFDATPAGCATFVEHVQWAEAAGFNSLWIGEGRLMNSGVVPVTLALANTSRISVGTGVLPYRTRNVALLAVTFKTFEGIAPGRIKMGLGAWWEPIASRVGVPNRKPLKAMREIITVCTALFEGEANVTYHGEFVDVEDIRFDAPNDDHRVRYDIPIYIGAVGPQMLELVGEIAAGVLLDFLLPVEYSTMAMDRLSAGAAKVGRGIEDIDRPQLVACSVDDANPADAVDDCRAWLTRYIGQQPHIQQWCGVETDLVEKIKAELGWPTTTADIRRAMRHIPDDLVHRVSACGTTTRALDAIEAYADAGATEIVLQPVTSNRHATVSSLAQASGLRPA